MSHRLQSNRAEPARTRKASKKEKETKSTSDIAEAFNKMASKSKVKATSNDSKSNNNERQSLNEKQVSANISQDANVEEDNAFEDEASAISVSNDMQSNDEHDKTQIAAEGQNEMNEGPQTESEKEVTPNEVLTALKELTASYANIDNLLNHPTKGIGSQAVKLNLRCDDLYTDIHGAVSGLLVRVDKLEKENLEKEARIKHMEETQKRLSEMITENKRLSKDLVMAQGLIQKYSQKINTMESKITDLTRRGMEQNVVIHGIEEVGYPGKENCVETVMGFLQEKLLIREVDKKDLWKVYRMGKPNKDRARPMFVKLAYVLKDKVMENVSNLKDQKNKHSQAYFVSEQIPEGIVETRKQLAQRAKMLKDKEMDKPETQRREVKILGDKIVCAGEVVNPPITTPQPFELFPGAEEQHKINQIASKIKEARPLYERHSTFVGLAVDIASMSEIDLAYKAVMQRFPFMDHVMLGYQLKENDQLKHGSCDDTEHGGGVIFDKLLYARRLKNIAVFVVHRYGGIHLGFDRFKTIEKAANEAIEMLRP